MVEREVLGEDGFGSLSEQEVDNILDNTEAMIESAHQTLIELLSQQDEGQYRIPLMRVLLKLIRTAGSWWEATLYVIDILMNNREQAAEVSK